MANGLDELDGTTMDEGLDTKVIAKRLKAEVTWKSTLFEVLLWVLGILPGLIFLFMKIGAENHLRRLEQRINTSASEIDNLLEQRVMILKNAARLVDKAVDLDKDVMTTISAYRGGVNPNDDEVRNDVAGKIEEVNRKVNIAFENYPNLQAHEEIQQAMQQNNYLQKEITAARTVYNDTINKWNEDIMIWPTKRIVAAKHGYTTRIPFITTSEIKKEAREVFF